MKSASFPPYPLATFALAALLALGACVSDDDGGGSPADGPLEVPETYFGFSGVDYAGQQSRLAQLGELKEYMKTTSPGAPLDSARLSAMYRNAPGAGFTRSYEKQLADKTFAPHRDRYEDYFGRIARLSQLDQPAAPGVAGYGAALNDKVYLLAANGVEYLQAIEKGLMGATLYYQATSVYLGADRMSADNTDAGADFATDREHHWDEAFGYLGVPRDFPSNTDGVVFWGDYCNDRDADLATNAALMDGLLLGRAAIGADDAATLERAIAAVRTNWERVVVGTAIHYLNQALDHADDPPRRMHDLTEAVAFAKAIVYNEAARMNPGEVDALVADLAGSDAYAAMDLYAVTDAEIVAARDVLAARFELPNSEAL